MKLVVARYNEDIEWTKKFKDVIIYNKGLPLVGDSNVIELSNVGREGHTYYHYIFTNYDDLDKYTVFLQGNPYDHTPNLEDVITRLQTFQGDFLSITKETCMTTNIFDNANPELPLMKVYEYLFGECSTLKVYHFGVGAQFIVSRDCIHKHPKEFYGKIVNLLSKEKNPIEGYIIERFHPLIFGES